MATNAMTSFKAQMLWEAIAREDLSAVHSILENGHINLEERDQNGCTFLMAASELGAIHIVRELLQIGVDPNAVDNEKWSALLCACKQGYLEVVIELLEHNADMEHTDMCGWSALMWSCYKGRNLVVNELLDRGANPNLKADHNMTCLSWAAGRGHTEIAKMLIDKGAKVNMPDKYGTTPLIWACRKGHADIVEALLGEEAGVDASGMNSWTPLLVATKGGHADVVRLLLSQGPNVNATDKDGLTALGIAAKEGFTEAANELLSKGAYVNMVDRTGDSILIHAVKGGHVDVVTALLKKYADGDQAGQDGKTALYCAVEKGYTEIVRLLLQTNPDLEICTKDEDTPLLRAVRTRNEECVWMFLEKGAKVSATDKRGDTALHISIRARAKRITELLLRNPRHSRLLYRKNKSGESPYSMDTNHQRGILPQIYGHGNLNATDAENLLGYEIYSSALADILSEPGLISPLTLGLYAKWGSGKSFLLDKLTSEMKVFTQQNNHTELTWSWITAFLILLLNIVVGEAIGLAYGWQIGLGVALGMLPFQYGFQGFIILCTRKYDFSPINRLSAALGRKQRLLVLLMQMLFCHPKQRTVSKDKSASAFSVRFLFSECTRLTSVGGEKSLAAMIGTLCDAVEKEYGVFIARLFRVFKADVSKGPHRGVYKSICCLPYFLLVVLVVACVLVGAGLAIHFGIESSSMPVNSVLIALTSVVALLLVANLYTWGQVVMALVLSQKRRVIKAADGGAGQDIKMDGFMQQLKKEVDLMSRMVNAMDGFTNDQTRLVVIVDGLDSCEQTKVLQVLDTVKSLFSDDGSPFVTVLAVDPHIIIKGIEQNLRSSYQDTNVNGFDYLRNVVHLPFYLQSQGLRIQHVEHLSSTSPRTNTGEGETPSRPHRLKSHDSTVGVNESRLNPSTSHHKNVRAMGSTSRVGGGSVSGSLPGIIYASSFDLANTFVRSDYFSDINPRSMRRLMNIVAVTARLLRAYNIDFKWQRLAAWINLTEQWPYRLSWIIYVFEEADHLDNNTSLYTLYQRINSSIPATKEQDPLLEIDRNVRKLEAFLTSRSGNFPQLGVSDLRKFLPCTINLDPYLRKLIRENQHNMERQQAELATITGVLPPGPGPPSSPGSNAAMANTLGLGDRFNPLAGGQASTAGNPPPARLSMPPVSSHPLLYSLYQQPAANPYGSQQPHSQLINTVLQLQQQQLLQRQQQAIFAAATASNKVEETKQAAPPPQPCDFFKSFSSSVVLSKLSVEEVCDLISNLRGLSQDQVKKYQSSIEDNNISGLVITMCDVMELQPVVNMKFGDWQLFRSAINALKEFEKENAFTTTTRDAASHQAVTISVPVLTSSSCSTNASSTSQTFTTTSCSSNTDAKDSRQRSCSQPERGSFTKSEPLKKQEAKLTRKDSIIQQLSYESAILKSAVSEFLEESEEEEEDFESEMSPEDQPSLFRLGSDETLSHFESSQPDQRSQTSSSSAVVNFGATDTLSVSGIDESSSRPSDDGDTHNKAGSESSSKFSTMTASVTDISPFITILDEPGKKKFGAGGYGSSEFSPLLGSTKQSSSSCSGSSDIMSTSTSSFTSSKPVDPAVAVSTHHAEIHHKPSTQPPHPPPSTKGSSSSSSSGGSALNRQVSILQQLHKQPRVLSPSTSVEETHQSHHHSSSCPGLVSPTTTTTPTTTGQSSQTVGGTGTAVVFSSTDHQRHHSHSHSAKRSSRAGSLSSTSSSQHDSPARSSTASLVQEDLMGQSRSTVVEMWPLDRQVEAEGNRDFHARLGQAFGKIDRAGSILDDASSSQQHLQQQQQLQQQGQSEVVVVGASAAVSASDVNVSIDEADKETHV